jgi:hypothetical protein
MRTDHENCLSGLGATRCVHAFANAAWIVCALVAVGTLTGCRGSDTTAPGSQAGLISLTVGARWVYAEYDSVEFGSLQPVSYPIRYTVSVSRDTVISGERWALVDNAGLLLDNQFDESLLLANRPNGLYRFATVPPALSGLVPTASMAFPYPVAIKQRFGPARNWVVANTDTVVAVPAGSFHCIRYDEVTEVGVPMTASVFIAPGTGIVMQVSFPITATDSSGQLIWVVRSVLRLASVTGTT